MTQTQFSGLEDFGELGEIDLLSSDLGFYQEKAAEQEVQLLSEFGGIEDVNLNSVSIPSQSQQIDITKFGSVPCGSTQVIEPNKQIPSSFHFQALSILNDFTSRSRLMNGKKIHVSSYDRPCTEVSDPKSTIAIVSLAGEKFIRCFSQRIDDVSLQSNPFTWSFMGLSDEESRDVELVLDLLVCAEKVGNQQFGSATKLIMQCEKLSSKTGNPVRRLAYYFSKALSEKINQETGRSKYIGSGKKQLLELSDALMCANPNIIALHQKVPFSQVCQFTAMQTIAENVRGARRVHIIDTEIRNGVQYTVLMQVLAAQDENSLQHLKITALGTKSRLKIEEAGERLMSFAQTLNLPFSFNVVMVASMFDLNIDLFELDDEEEVAVYSACWLTTLILQSDHLDCLMNLIRKLNPCVMVMTEIEANLTSPAFANRFIEALFYYGAFFDALADCMADVESNRRVLEADFGIILKNIVAAEGTERIVRPISLDVWRTYFARFGLAEADLSSVSEYQADLLVGNFKCRSSCTLDMDGKCLVVGWKGAPIFSVSAWKFL